MSGAPGTSEKSAGRGRFMGCCPPAGAICGAPLAPGWAPGATPAEGGGCWRGSAAAYLQYASAIAVGRGVEDPKPP
uniref:Uncharacterized protein n=1 Tax=Arundo donax TaxID=35708 RepID=A0A0A9GGA3_ARUDO